MADESLTQTNPEDLAGLHGGTTIGKDVASHYRKAGPRLRWVGILTPIAGLAPEKIRIDRDLVTVGRDKTQNAVIPDGSVSRKHACIRRKGDEFVIEDLDSSNGTHIDDVPVISCVLHDGDTVQFGQNLYYFERTLEPVFESKWEQRDE